MEYTLFFPQFSNLVITVLAFVLCLSIIVFVHEFGHYFVGKLSGIHAEVFSIGFGPVLISKYDKRGTKWQIAAFPLGGYVKFLGDKNSASAPDLKRNFEDDQSFLRRSIHGAPLWARFMTVAAGPIFNFVFSGLIFFLIYMNQGTTTFPLTVDKLFEAPYKQKFEEGDIVRSVNGIPAETDLTEFVSSVGNSFSEEFLTYVVERNGRLVTLNNVVQNPPRVSQVLPKSSAIMAGLKKGDFILSLNSIKISNFNQIKESVEASEGDVLTCRVVATDSKGITVKPDGCQISTFIKKSQLASSPTDQRSGRWTLNDKIDVLLEKKDRRKVSLSIRALEEKLNAEALKKYGAEHSGRSLPFANLAELSKNQKDETEE